MRLGESQVTPPYMCPGEISLKMIFKSRIMITCKERAWTQQLEEKKGLTEGLQLNDHIGETVDEVDLVDMMYLGTQKVFNKVRLKTLLRELRGQRMSGKLLLWVCRCPRRKQRGGLDGQLWQKVTARCLVPGVPCCLTC